MHKANPKGGRVNGPRSIFLPVMERKSKSKYPHLPCLSFGIILRYVLHHLADWIHLPKVETGLVSPCLLASFPFAPTFPNPLLVYPGVIYYINYFHLSPSLSVCFWGELKILPYIHHLICLFCGTLEGYVPCVVSFLFFPPDSCFSLTYLCVCVCVHFPCYFLNCNFMFCMVYL